MDLQSRLVKRISINKDIEKMIAIAAITSDEFCREMIPVFNINFFQVDYIKTIMKWIIEYYSEYKRAPKKQIQDIYNIEKENLKEADKDIISVLLSRLSNEYDDENNFNYQYVVDQMFRYFKKRNLYLLFEKGMGYLAKNKINKAENIISVYGKISKLTGNWINPFDKKAITDLFIFDKNEIFSFPGALGELTGCFERDWFCAFLAPMKRGKSWYLQEVAMQSVFAKKKVLFISLEMSKEIILKRIMFRVAAKIIGSKNKEIFIPVFDCLNSQDGSCHKKIKKGRGNIIRDGSILDVFDPNIKYRPCTVCRGKNEDYIPAVWGEKLIQREEFTLKKAKKIANDFLLMYGDNFRLISYPAFSAVIDDIRVDLDALAFKENFIPDVIVIDYADILASENRYISERGNIDVTWKKLKGLATERHCLVFSASQSNRGSIAKKNVTQIDTAEDIRKIAHVDAMFSINQTAKEKTKGVCRIGTIAHRHMEFDEFKTVTVLQQLKIGQPLLDSEWGFFEKK